MFRLVVVALLCLACPASGWAADARAPISVGRLTLMPCQPGYGGYCGQIERALDPSGRIPGRLSIGFEWYPRRDTDRPALGTLAAQEGGPGYSTTGSRDGYVRMLDPLRERRDILLMDKRGTGLSGALDCPTLQAPRAPKPADYAACGDRLGPAAWLYGTALAADDLAALLDALGVGKIDLYGDSYGTFVGQVFAARHADRLRTLVLDSAYPVRGLTPWFASEYANAPRALELVCRRSPACAALPGDPVTRLRRLVTELRARPLTGVAPDPEGVPRRVTAEPATLFLMLDLAGNSPVTWRDFDAAARAYLDDGDGQPLLRLTAEAVVGNALGGGSAADFSAGLAVAVVCSDYPQPFDFTARPAARRAQIAGFIAEMKANRPDLYDPFTIDEALAAPYQPIGVEVCQDWPAPPPGITPGRPVSRTAIFPQLPVLVINGELDTVTSPRDGRQAAALFPWPRYVLVDNAIHETAIGDAGYFIPPFGGDVARCAQPIVLRFIESAGDPGDLECTRRTRPIRTVPSFARLTRDVALPTRLAPGASDAALRAASAAAEAVGDVLARYYVTTSGTGAGLRGGTFDLAATRDGYRFTLDRVRFTEDLAVSGTIVWNQRDGTVLANVRLFGAASGILSLAWNDRRGDALCEITGMIDGGIVAASRIAP